MAVEAPTVYVKFGETPGAGSEREPWIEGDSDDTQHFWWCELRDVGFGLENPDELLEGEVKSGSGEGDSKGTKESKSKFKEVRIRKRVDWASTQLFMKCCEAPDATAKMAAGIKMNETDKVKGWLDQITIEVGRPSGEETGIGIPFAIYRFYSVNIIDYSIDINGPEPAESITFKFEAFEFEYQQTDPYTGAKKGASVKSRQLPNFSDADGSKTGGSGAGSGGGEPSSDGQGSKPGGPGLGAGAVVAAAGHGAPATLVTATDDAARSNFPALWSDNGFGLLPDNP